MFTTYLPSPLGSLEINGTTAHIHSVMFAGAEHKPAPGHEATTGPMPKAVRTCIRQLEEYFEGKRLVFDLPLSAEGTDFQRKIWHLLLDIPYGTTISYLDLSRRHGDEKAIRAVGKANGSNPIAIIVPCHRVIGHDGKLVGYGGDLWRKEWLLRHELEHAPVPQGRLF
jgi:methylated-DNA-[protein]-cysteine S-methyltransferase